MFGKEKREKTISEIIDKQVEFSGNFAALLGYDNMAQLFKILEEMRRRGFHAILGEPSEVIILFEKED